VIKLFMHVVRFAWLYALKMHNPILWNQISRLQFEGVIDREVASHLRENVYYLQMALGE